MTEINTCNQTNKESSNRRTQEGVSERERVKERESGSRSRNTEREKGRVVRVTEEREKEKGVNKPERFLA